MQAGSAKAFDFTSYKDATKHYVPLRIAARVLLLDDFFDAYRPAVVSESAARTFWYCPPYVPLDSDFLASGALRTRLFWSRIGDPYIAKFHNDRTLADREEQTGRLLSHALKLADMENDMISLRLIVPEPKTVISGLGEAWIVEPYIEHKCSFYKMLCVPNMVPRPIAIRVLKALIERLVANEMDWRGLAPRNLLLVSHDPSQMTIALCDFERGRRKRVSSYIGGYLEQLSFWQEEFSNVLCERELISVFGATSLSALNTGDVANNIDIPISEIDSARLRWLLTKDRPSEGFPESVSLIELEAVRKQLRWWQRVEVCCGRVIDPIPLLDAIFSSASAQERIAFTEWLGNLRTPERALVVRKMELAARLSTIFELCLDASTFGQVPRAVVLNRAAVQQRLVSALQQEASDLPFEALSEHAGWSEHAVSEVVQELSRQC